MKLAFSLLALATLGLSLLHGDAEEPRWLDDLPDAVELAKETGRPLLVVFR